MSSSKHTVTQIFTDLARLDEELAVLMERARKHQERWKRMEQLKRETIEVESQVRSALSVLEEGRRDLEMVVKDAKEVVSSIELAEKSEPSRFHFPYISGRQKLTLIISFRFTRPNQPRNSALLRFVSFVLHFSSSVRSPPSSPSHL